MDETAEGAKVPPRRLALPFLLQRFVVCSGALLVIPASNGGPLRTFLLAFVVTIVLLIATTPLPGAAPGAIHFRHAWRSGVTGMALGTDFRCPSARGQRQTIR